MNENQMKMILPPTVGILVAGVASGICYLLIGSLRKRKSSQIVSYDDSRCACCLKPFLVGRGVECNDCGARSCRKACCRWDSVENSWFCLFCYHSRSRAKRREKWFRSFGGLPVEPENHKNFRTAKSQIYDEGVEHVAIHTELDLAAGGCKEGDSMETVREFVEKIVEGMVGNVDDTPIDRLYDHQAYDQICQEYGAILANTLTRLAMSLRQCIDNKPATDTPTMAHTALRELVERAVDEARNLPCLGATVSTQLHEDPTFSEQNYEDLLATAILNKVIEKFQNERIDDNSNVVERRIRSKYVNQDNENGLDEGVEEGSSSLEPFSQDECSSEGSGSQMRHTRIRKEPISLTIEEQIEEVTTTYGSDDDVRCSKTDVLDFRNSRRVPFPEFGMDIVDPLQDSSDDSQEESNDFTHVDMITPVESWEENWLFQRRKIPTQSEPVSMLVPNPSADYRALIGDKDAEETSDLSELSAHSDDEIDDDELIEAINRSMPKSKSVEDTNNTEIDKIHNKKIEKLSKTTLKDNTIDERNEEKKQEELDVNEEFEKVFRQNVDGNYDIEEEEDLFKNNEIEKNSKLLETSYDLEKIISQCPKKPKTIFSPMKNSRSNLTGKNSSGSDIRISANNDDCVDKKMEKKLSEEDSAALEICDKKSCDKIGKDGRSTYDVNENFKSSTMNGCLEAVSQDQPMTEISGDRCNGVARKTVENSFVEEFRLNGNVEKSEKHETMENGSDSKDEVDGECRSPTKAKVSSALENPSSKNLTNDNIEFASPPRPGTIAEREHKKWENAAPIENNPYSEENIQKRLLERQYARRSSSDVSGSSSKLQPSPSPPLQIVLGAGRPDFKRFGRDYYINEGKGGSNNRSIETGFYTASSRPNSSMSQNSLSTGSDYEHQQERSRSVETESTCSTSSDSRKKVTSSRRNNFEIDHRRGSTGLDREYEKREMSNHESTNNDRRQSMSDVSQNSYDEIFESERKNNKNEINARLNNRGNYEDGTRPIKRIDLRAYGFENEFNMRNSENNSSRRKSKRVINKLDLRSFGYDSGLRRTQSNNHIDSGIKINLPIRSRSNFQNFETKSNLIEQRSMNEILTASTESLNDATRRKDSENFGKIKSAKSVPNIDQLCSRINERNGESRHKDDDTENNSNPESIIYDENIDSIKNGKNEITKNVKLEVHGSKKIETRKKSSLPSVKKLAQAFDKTQEIIFNPSRKPSKTGNNSSRDRPTTPEVHIVDTPRQMHSLTARSISREFREGLRQITSKQTPSPQITAEKNESMELSPKRSKQIENQEEISLLKPGKLKSDIKFWEQMHRKS